MRIVGIDVSKEHLAVCLQAERDILNEEEFGNHEKGFKAIKKAIKKWLKPQRLAEVHICMEATNVYWEEAAEYFYAAGAKVSVVNPVRTKGFAMSQLRRNKTDKVDARDIAAFCAATPDLTLWTPPTPVQRKLRALVRHREALVKTRTQQSNRLQTAREKEVKASLQSVIAMLNEQIEQINQQISDLIDQEPGLKEDYELLCTIKGIGGRTAERMLAEMYDLAQYESARAAAADAGLTPAHHESGTTVRRKPKLSKVGKASLRSALFFPAMSAVQSNPIIQRMAERLEKRGKTPKVILGAAMRKLLHIAYGVLKNRTPFDPDHQPVHASLG